MVDFLKRLKSSTSLRRWASSIETGNKMNHCNIRSVYDLFGEYRFDEDLLPARICDAKIDLLEWWVLQFLDVFYSTHIFDTQ